MILHVNHVQTALRGLYTLLDLVTQDKAYVNISSLASIR